MKILITGIPGTGKSTIGKALKEKGYNTLDFTDILGLCYWRDKETGDRVEYSPTDDRSWLLQHERICDIENLKEFLNENEGVVISGIAMGNPTEYFNLFDKVFVLQCMPEVLVNRLENRKAWWGETEAERNLTLEWQKEFDQECEKYNVVFVENNGGVDQALKVIFSHIK